MAIQEFRQRFIDVKHSLRIECPPGKLPCEGNYVKRELFPELFSLIGLTYQPISGGVRQFEGNPQDTFKLPDYRGKFLEPVDQDTPIAITAQGDFLTSPSSIVEHPHNVITAPAQHEGQHELAVGTPPTPPAVGTFGRGTDAFAWYNHFVFQFSSVLYGTQSTPSGSHGHIGTISEMSEGGEETRPKNVAMPTYINAGRWSERAIAFIPNSNYIESVGYNTRLNYWNECANTLALQNIHTYRMLHPDSYPEAEQEIERQLTLLKMKYKYLYVIGVGSGANIGVNVINNSGIEIEKFVGVNGIYDLTDNIPTGYLNNFIIPYLGTSNMSAREAASCDSLSIPYRLWHGNDNTTILPAQSIEYGDSGNVEIKSNLDMSTSYISSGVLDEILTFLNS